LATILISIFSYWFSFQSLYGPSFLPDREPNFLQFLLSCLTMTEYALWDLISLVNRIRFLSPVVSTLERIQLGFWIDELIHWAPC
jgi:hypothetical protein